MFSLTAWHAQLTSPAEDSPWGLTVCEMQHAAGLGLQGWGCEGSARPAPPRHGAWEWAPL